MSKLTFLSLKQYFQTLDAVIALGSDYRHVLSMLLFHPHPDFLSEKEPIYSKWMPGCVKRAMEQQPSTELLNILLPYLRTPLLTSIPHSNFFHKNHALCQPSHSFLPIENKKELESIVKELLHLNLLPIEVWKLLFEAIDRAWQFSLTEINEQKKNGVFIRLNFSLFFNQPTAERSLKPSPHQKSNT